MTEQTWIRRILGFLTGREERPQGTPPIPVPELPEDMIADGYPRKVVGESYYQRALERIAGPKTADVLRTEVMAVLFLDNGNSHDANAVAVFIDDRKVGHLSRSDAERFRIIVERRSLQGRRFSCPARLTGGWDRDGNDVGSIGVELALSFAGQPSVRTPKG